MDATRNNRRLFRKRFHPKTSNTSSIRWVNDISMDMKQSTLSESQVSLTVSYDTDTRDLKYVSLDVARAIAVLQSLRGSATTREIAALHHALLPTQEDRARHCNVDRNGWRSCAACMGRKREPSDGNGQENVQSGPVRHLDSSLSPQDQLKQAFEEFPVFAIQGEGLQSQRFIALDLAGVSHDTPSTELRHGENLDVDIPEPLRITHRIHQRARSDPTTGRSFQSQVSSKATNVLDSQNDETQREPTSASMSSRTDVQSHKEARSSSRIKRSQASQKVKDFHLPIYSDQDAADLSREYTFECLASGPYDSDEDLAQAKSGQARLLTINEDEGLILNSINILPAKRPHTARMLNGRALCTTRDSSVRPNLSGVRVTLSAPTLPSLTAAKRMAVEPSPRIVSGDLTRSKRTDHDLRNHQDNRKVYSRHLSLNSADLQGCSRNGTDAIVVHARRRSSLPVHRDSPNVVHRVSADASGSFSHAAPPLTCFIPNQQEGLEASGRMSLNSPVKDSAVRSIKLSRIASKSAPNLSLFPQIAGSAFPEPPRASVIVEGPKAHCVTSGKNQPPAQPLSDAMSGCNERKQKTSSTKSWTIQGPRMMKPKHIHISHTPICITRQIKSTELSPVPTGMNCHLRRDDRKHQQDVPEISRDMMEKVVKARLNASLEAVNPPKRSAGSDLDLEKNKGLGAAFNPTPALPMQDAPDSPASPSRDEWERDAQAWRERKRSLSRGEVHGSPRAKSTPLKPRDDVDDGRHSARLRSQRQVPMSPTATTELCEISSIRSRTRSESSGSGKTFHSAMTCGSTVKTTPDVSPRHSDHTCHESSSSSNTSPVMARGDEDHVEMWTMSPSGALAALEGCVNTADDLGMVQRENESFSTRSSNPNKKETLPLEPDFVWNCGITVRETVETGKAQQQNMQVQSKKTTRYSMARDMVSNRSFSSR